MPAPDDARFLLVFLRGFAVGAVTIACFLGPELLVAHGFGQDFAVMTDGFAEFNEDVYSRPGADRQGDGSRRKNDQHYRLPKPLGLMHALSRGAPGVGNSAALNYPNTVDKPLYGALTGTFWLLFSVFVRVWVSFRV